MSYIIVIMKFEYIFTCICLIWDAHFQQRILGQSSGPTRLVCENGGTAYIDKTSTPKCLCTTGFMGSTCKDPDPCLPSPCQHHGTCTPVASTSGTGFDASCLCLPGYSGSRCEIESPACASSPCVNGECLNNASSYHCVCPPGYEGQQCQTFIGFCGTGAASCKEKDVNAVCIEGDQGYSCQCSNGNQYGFNCESPALDLPSTGCGDLGNAESYCVCSANGEIVKVPLERPHKREKGVKSRDFILGLVGLLLGWLLGTALLIIYYCSCYNNETVVANNARVEPMRPNTASSMQSESTTLSQYMHSDTKPILPTQAPSTAVAGLSQAATMPQPSSTLQPIAESASLSEPIKNTNIYRASFVDDMAHKVSHRKSPLTYSSADKDW